MSELDGLAIPIGGEDEPSLRPTATALDGNKKRKHDEILDVVADDAAVSARQQSVEIRMSSSCVEDTRGRNDSVEEDEEEDDEDDDDDDDDDGNVGELFEVNAEVLEEIMDSFELEPYAPDIEDEISPEQIKTLRARLRCDGVEKFFNDNIVDGDRDPRWLGQAFGLNPHIAVSDDDYLKLLGLAVMRFFYKRQKLPQHNTINDAAKLLKQSKNVIVITGAGICTSLGIPDFRSKNTGFYDKVRAQGFDEPEAVFDLAEFDFDPSKFFKLIGDILPSCDRWSPTHAFIRLLQDRGILLTNYTQNIDNIESNAGIEESKLIQCHGSFATATCRKCKHQVKGTEIFDDMQNQRVARCRKCVETLSDQARAPRPQVKSTKSRTFASDDEDEDDNIPEPGIMKPDITFFGEQLSNTFFDRLTDHDAKETDLVIVIGTSLKVAPVSEVPNYLPHEVPHIYISKEPIAHIDFDIQLLGSCDDVVTELCRRAGWEFKHEMIPADFKVDIRPTELNKHVWNIVPAASRPT